MAKGKKKFTLAVLKIWNPEKGSYYFFDLGGEKEKSIWYLIISEIQEHPSEREYLTTPLSMLDTVHRFFWG